MDAFISRFCCAHLHRNLTDCGFVPSLCACLCEISAKSTHARASGQGWGAHRHHPSGGCRVRQAQETLMMMASVLRSAARGRLAQVPNRCQRALSTRARSNARVMSTANIPTAEEEEAEWEAEWLAAIADVRVNEIRTLCFSPPLLALRCAEKRPRHRTTPFRAHRRCMIRRATSKRVRRGFGSS